MTSPVPSTPEPSSPDHPSHDPATSSSTGTPPTRVILVRHGVTDHTGPILSGRLPGIDLSERGREQARRTGELLADVRVAAVYSSPIERTVQTAELVAAPHGLAVTTDDGLLEADYGEWTGGRIADLVGHELWKVVQRAPSRAVFPGGESIVAMQSRMITALDGLASRHRGETIVVVSHADPIKSAVAHYTGVHLDLFQRIVVSPASFTVIEIAESGAPALVCSNYAGSPADLFPTPEAGAAEAAPPPAAGSQDRAPARVVKEAIA